MPTITPNSAPQPQARAFRRLGRTAFFTAVLAIGIQVVAIVLANNQHLLLATGLAWVSIVVSAAAVLGGVVAAIQGKRRRLAVVAIVLGVLGNPLVLVWLFAALGS